jgi:hypothetical protein
MRSVPSERVPAVGPKGFVRVDLPANYNDTLGHDVSCNIIQSMLMLTADGLDPD